jgi:hypothetical protein
MGKVLKLHTDGVRVLGQRLDAADGVPHRRKTEAQTRLSFLLAKFFYQILEGILIRGNSPSHRNSPGLEILFLQAESSRGPDRNPGQRPEPPRHRICKRETHNLLTWEAKSRLADKRS